jgi:hypothetical protein
MAILDFTIESYTPTDEAGIRAPSSTRTAHRTSGTRCTGHRRSCGTFLWIRLLVFWKSAGWGKSHSLCTPLIRGIFHLIRNSSLPKLDLLTCQNSDLFLVERLSTQKWKLVFTSILLRLPAPHSSRWMVPLFRSLLLLLLCFHE